MYQSIDIVMEDGHDENNHQVDTSNNVNNGDKNRNNRNRNRNRNNTPPNTPTEISFQMDSNSNSLDEESSINIHQFQAEHTTDNTYLLNGMKNKKKKINKKKRDSDDTTSTKTRTTSTTTPADTPSSAAQSFGSISELKNAIQKEPFVSACVMFVTLFFGFSVGFSVGYLASEKGYLTSIRNEVELQSSNYVHPNESNNYNGNNNDSINNNNKVIQTSIVNLDDMQQLNLIESQNKVWEFLDNYIFHESTRPDSSVTSSSSLLSPSLESNHKSQFKKDQENPLLRFPFQSGSSTPRPIRYLNRPDAYSLLIDSLSGGTIATMSEYANDFFLISSGLDAQINQAYCGPASAVAILNSLRFLKSTIYDGVDIPTDKVYDSYPYATQKDIFNECTQKNVISHTGGGPGVDGIVTPPYGLSMPQMANLLRCHLNTTTTTTSGIGWSVNEHYVDKSHITPGKMRFDIKNALSDRNSRVIVNFDRSSVGQDGSGHWSPVGSYSEKHDAFLILDVAKYKYPPVWIPTERLFVGLATYDDCGTWNFPDGQSVLTQEERMAHEEDGFDAILYKLGCQKKLRGYITVTRT